jgi:hypothetical protein
LVVVGLGLGKRAGRGALRLRKCPARFGRGLVAQRGMRPDVVVAAAPWDKPAVGVGPAVAGILSQAFVVQAAVDGLDLNVPHWLAHPANLGLQLIGRRAARAVLLAELGGRQTNPSSSLIPTVCATVKWHLPISSSSSWADPQ